jgi:hypothetical protein
MAQHDEKQFLDLLQVYKSEDTKKARRNLSSIGFVVISAWLLRIQLTDVKVLGIDLSHTSELVVLLLGLVLVIYWSMIFYLFLTHDSEIQKERSIQLEKSVSALTSRLATLEELHKQNSGVTGYIMPEYSEVKSAVEAYERQKARTATAAKYGGIINGFETYVPTALAVVSAFIIIARIIHNL